MDRTKDTFTFPIHRHQEYELNFVENCAGATRVVGDSIETLGEFDLCLIGNGIEHAWEQGECKSRQIREITIQFDSHLFGEEMLMKNQMASIRSMLQDSSKGITFGMKTIMKIYNRLDSLLKAESGFYQMVEFLTMLYEMSIATDRRILSSSSFANANPASDSRRVRKVHYISSHYKEEIRLETIAALAGKCPYHNSRMAMETITLLAD